MPIYEYRCLACGHEIEVIQKMSDAPLVQCPECAQPKLKKKLSAVAFHLKGSGWYKTDFKDAGKKKAPGSEAKETPPEVKETKESKETGGETKEACPDKTMTPSAV